MNYTIATKDFDTDKLKGSENYNSWAFDMHNILVWRELDKCIDDPITETNTAKLAKARALLCLNVEKSIQSHIKSCETATEVWQKLKSLYEDKGLSRKISLLRNLTSARLENADNIQAYIDDIKVNVNRLNDIGFKISDEWISSIILAGLTDTYQAFIMGIEASGKDLSPDTIITKLLDTQQSKSGYAFFMKKKKKKGNQKCYKCGENWHKSHKCNGNKKGDKFEKKRINGEDGIYRHTYSKRK